MEIFVRQVPHIAGDRDVKRFFQAPLDEFGVHEDFHAEKIRNTTLAVLTVLDVSKAEAFLQIYGVPQSAPRYVQAVKPLIWNGQRVLCSLSRNTPSPQSVQSLIYTAQLRRQKRPDTTAVTLQNGNQNAKLTRFAINGLQCGTWDYTADQLQFFSHFSDPRQGSISFGQKGVVIVLGGGSSEQCRIDLEYYNCQSIVMSGAYGDPTISFALRFAPKFYLIQRDDGVDALANALMGMTLGYGGSKSASKARLPAINPEHAKIAGCCFVYRVRLSESSKLGNVRSILDRCAKSAPLISQRTASRDVAGSLEKGFARLNHAVTDTSLHGKLPFSLRYHILRLAMNGVLSPTTVHSLLPKISQIHQSYGQDAASSATSRLYRQIPFAGPDIQSHELAVKTLEDHLEQLAVAYQAFKHNPENPYELIKRHQHIILVHKVVITPAGTYLEAPEPEPTNRVLRRYASHSDHFLRVVFQDEDRGQVRYDARADQKQIFEGRFKGLLDGNILIAGRPFSFLGFSHSSLRAQSCWFMAPIFHQGTLRLPEHILRELGDFSHIRVPAKCAARIGQNFTDTNATVDLSQNNVYELPIVTRNGYDFSDGVGTISEDLLRRVWRVYGTRRALKPTALQIRFQGYKGMVALDSRLTGERIMLRSNMKKFESAGAWNLEICGAAIKPLPLVLNRSLIKILEDLGVQAHILLDLQKQAVDCLRFITTTNAINASSFLEEMDSPKSTQMPSLIRLLWQIGLDYRQDPFLAQVVEMAVVSKLRDIKYRGRIPIRGGNTLYGIMDETGFLREGEVYVVTESSPDGGRQELVKNRIAVSRSPALMPGDIQLVNAVDVPPNSPLKRLMNVIVFSQHGHRDLPSQLSGGDLDGDQFHVITEPGLIPPCTFMAALYPRASALELDRPVTRKDMSDFFVKFMESDQLGMISNLHMQLADQHPEGTLHPQCITLATMASTAVDFSKTGIAVDMKQCPKYDRLKPDFMAPSPRIFVDDHGHIDQEEDDVEEDPAFEDLDVEKRAIRYYQSSKVLGQLYRAIDEQQFLVNLQRERQAAMPDESKGILHTLLAYMKKMAKSYGVLFAHHLDLARAIRVGYEDSLADILHIYAPSANIPLSEHEAFAGTILGRKGGAQSKPLRELNTTMRERFSAIVDYTIMRIVKGDEQMHGVSDLDALYEDHLDRELEALPRAIACLMVGVEEAGMRDARLGELQSFKYLVAGVCLREFERFSVTTMGSYALPRV